MGKEVVIAVAGKGGTGKTTFAALMLRHLTSKYKNKAILAVDADANANLNEALGMEVEDTISSALEATKDPRAVPTGMTKDMFMEMRVSQCMVESDLIDLLVMGNPTGPGCYCYPNNLLKNYFEKLRTNYDYIMVDNEAGLEHLSRRTIDDIDHFIITSDATARGIRSAARVNEIVKSLKFNVGKTYLVISRTRGNEVDNLKAEIDKTGLDLLGTIPLDEAVMDYDLNGKPLFELPDDSPAVQAVGKIVEKLAL
ncbi:MAG: AAA family ATPase [Dethiobacteria bacterium]|jgi:CO dehydrogenase maturation factor